MNHEDEDLAGALADTLASRFTLTSAMHLTIVNPDNESIDLNILQTSGFYLSRNKAGTNAPSQDVTWTVQVIIDDDNKAHRDVSASQTYQSPSGIWHRSSKDRGSTWSEWQSLMNEPAMPLKKTETNDLNQINKAGFYVGDGRDATNAPSSSTAWVLMVVAAPYGNQSYVAQTFYADNDMYWRRSQDNGSTWSDWTSTVNKPSMPLKILSGTVDLNQLNDTGVYIGPGTAGTHAPVADPAWSVEVMAQMVSGQTHVIQTYKSDSGSWWRSTSNGGNTWSEWHSDTNVPAMPLQKTETNNLNQINQAGFYVGNGIGATNAPNSNAAWVLMVVAAPYGSQSYVMQTFYTDNGIWWRRSQDNGSTWSDWTSLVDEPSMPLKTLSGTVDLNLLHDTGVYIGTGTRPTHSPFSQGSEWFLEILARASFISQTFITSDGRWSRYSLNRGDTWSSWTQWDIDIYPMPIRYWEEFWGDDTNLDDATANGFYYSPNKPAVNGPSDSALWTLMITGAPVDYRPLEHPFLSQTFFDPNGVWYRSSTHLPNGWTEWINLTESSLPLRTLSGTVDLNQLKDTGVYIGPGSAGTHAPASDAAWSVEVVAQTVSGQTHILQTYKSESGSWWRSSSNSGSTWSEWHSSSGTGTNQNFVPLTNLGGSDHIDLNQFKTIGYYVGNGYQANNAPNDNGSWVLMVLAAPYYNNPPYTTQYFFTDRGIWWRRSEDNGSTWSSWVNITSNDLVKAYGSAYLLGDAVIANNDFIPFTAMALSSDCQLDARTGEVIVNQSGVYSLSLSLHLNNNQPASFVISLDGETPEHHSSLHYEPAASTFTGIQPAHVTGMIQCEAGQRLGVKNLTAHSVTLRHAFNGRKCKHEFTLTKID
ncbi:exo-alpha-sialidase [Paenibacillus tritici]|uniref:pyocin knob domain-containing protein n=1 Tax=Paenibacillus tritici TaxID=1873425 RepID=UPI001BAD7630|nr:pyocin knob domain-containing protein [Paenibacillus tritici]QUL55675.1 exo-alpha-sialidase [Paenibacillus tritici]